MSLLKWWCLRFTIMKSNGDFYMKEFVAEKCKTAERENAANLITLCM